MTKRFSIFLLSLILVLLPLAMPLSAEAGAQLTRIDGYSATKPYYLPLGTGVASKLQPITEAPEDLSRAISFGLEGYAHTLSDTSTATDVAELADCKKYGISVIGFTAFEKGQNISTLTDGAYGTGFSMYTKDTSAYYNVNGEKATAEQIGTEGFAYRGLLTMNFGSVKTIDALGYIVNNGMKQARIPAAADVYVSDDGENWRLVAYYDRPADRVSDHLNGTNTDYSATAANTWGKDAQGATAAASLQGVCMRFPEGTDGQYLRLAFTVLQGGILNAGSASYADYTNSVTTGCGLREIMVFGEGAFGSETDDPETPDEPETPDAPDQPPAELDPEDVIPGSEITAISGYSADKPYYLPIGTGKVDEMTSVKAAPLDMSRAISFGLKGYSHSLENGSPYSEIAKLADHKSYGISAIGLTSFSAGQVLESLSDGVYGTGISLFATDPSAYYNVHGQKAPSSQIGTNGFAYRYLITLNFGSVKELEALGWIYNNSSVVAIPAAADVYVSDDGVNWRLVSYYDRPARKLMNSETLFNPDYKQVNASKWGSDLNGATASTNLNCCCFALPEGTTGQYVRLGVTAGAGQNVNSFSGELYSDFTQGISVGVGLRELVVFGKGAFSADALKPTVNQPAENESSEKETDTHPSPTETESISAPATEAPADTSAEVISNEKQLLGCGAAFGAQSSLIAVMLCCLLTLCCRRRKKSHSV